MSSLLAILFSLFLAFQGITLVKAGIYVVDPRQGTTCHGGEACTVTWLDDGSAPLLPAIGVVNVGLYTGQQQLIQALEPVDVSAVRALTFTPNPAAGPNSGAYYISFTSVEPLANETEPYLAFSPWFSLDRMTGSFETPLPSATSSVTIPSSLASSRPTTTSLSTITVGTLSTIPPTPTPSSSPITSESSVTSTASPSSQSPSPSPIESPVESPTSSGFITSIISSPAASIATSTSTSVESEESPAPSDGAEEDSGAATSTSLSLPASVLVCLVALLAL